MKRLITSDWQLDENPKNNYRWVFADFTLPSLVKKYKPDQLLMLGDITEAKDNHSASLVNETVDLFQQLSSLCDIVILQGNHDFQHKGYPFFRFLDHYSNITWIAEPTKLDDCLFLPHTRDHKTDWKGVEMYGHDYIFAHNIFTGASGNGQALSGIPTSIFPDDACVISGDVHEPQSFDVVTYVGAPYTCDFGDAYSPRVLLLDEMNIKSIKIPGQQKRIIEVSFNPKMDDWVFHGPYEEKDIIRFNVNLSMENVPSWDKIRAWVEKWATKRNVIADSIRPIVSYEQGDRPKLVKGLKKSDADYLTSYASRTGLDESTLRIGREMLDII